MNITVNDSGADYYSSDFNVELALTPGNPTGVVSSTFTETGWKLVESLIRLSDDYAIQYPYRASIEGQYYDFNENGNGVDSAGNTGFTIAMITAYISSAGEEQGDTFTPDQQSYYTMTSLNYRETIASQVLGFLIAHVDNPFGYNTSVIKLLVQRSFEFAVEFVNQAMALREADTTPGQQASPDMVGALDNVSLQLTTLSTQTAALVEALEGDPSATPAKVGIREGINNMVATLDGTNNNGVTAKLDTINTTIQTGDANIVTALGTTGQTLSNIQTNTQNTAARLQSSNNASAGNLLETISGRISSGNEYASDIRDSLNTLEQGNPRTAAQLLLGIKTNTSTIDSRLVDGNTSVAARAASIAQNTSGIGSIYWDVEDIKTHVASIDSKTQ